MAHKPVIRILNPVSGSPTRVTHRRAARLIDAGFADWEGSAIRLRHAISSSAASRFDPTAHSYDNINRVMQIRDLRGIPMARPQLALYGKDLRNL